MLTKKTAAKDGGRRRLKHGSFMRRNAPARGLFFLLLFLWTSKEKVDPIRKKILTLKSTRHETRD